MIKDGWISEAIFIFMHEITVHQPFPYGFRAFFLKMGWKCEILSHWHFWPKLLSVIHPPQGFQKKQKWMRNLNLYDWCFPVIQPDFKICKCYRVFHHGFSNLIQIEISHSFLLFWDAWQSLFLGNGSRNSVLDLGNMKGIRKQKSHCASEI